MTKSQLIEVVAAKLNITKSRAETAVNSIFTSMSKAMVDGEGIEIRGFGSFAVKQYRSRQGRNPKTGEPVAVPEKRRPRFKVGKELRELINEAFLAEQSREQPVDAE